MFIHYVKRLRGRSRDNEVCKIDDPNSTNNLVYTAFITEKVSSKQSVYNVSPFSDLIFLGKNRRKLSILFLEKEEIGRLDSTTNHIKIPLNKLFKRISNTHSHNVPHTHVI